MWRTLPLSRKPSCDPALAWESAQGRPDCLCPPGPLSRPLERLLSPACLALAEGAQVPQRPCPQSQAGGFGHCGCSALREPSLRPREKPEPDQPAACSCLLRGPRGSLARAGGPFSCPSRHSLVETLPVWPGLPGSCFTVAARALRRRPRVSSWWAGAAGSKVGQASWALGPPVTLGGPRCGPSVGPWAVLAHGGHHAGWVGVAEGEAGGGVDGPGWAGCVRRAEGWQVAHRRYAPPGRRAEGEALSCTHRDSSSKHSAPFLLFFGLADIFRFLGLDAFPSSWSAEEPLPGGYAELSEAGAPLPSQTIPQRPGQGPLL